jgi:hypothetical protein
VQLHGHRSGGSAGVSDMNTRAAKNGETVTCVFETTGQA